MSRSSFSNCLAAVALLSATCCLSGQTARAQEPAPAAATAGGAPGGAAPAFGHAWWQPPGDVRELAGVQNCYLCHTKTDVNKSLPPGIIPPGGADDGWVLLNELQTWAEKDKHYQAYAVLLNERSQQMARTLKVVDDQGNSLIHRDKRCLACHSSWPVDQLQTDAHGLITAELANDPRINLGVSCEGCHGASLGTANSKGWNDIHRIKNQWRFLPPAEKFATYGFWDVRTPVTKARICLSCHVGNVAQGKVLTHEMYAAGHPPLPPFELSTYIDQQPQHWRDFGAKKPEIRTEFLQQTKTTYDPEALQHSQTLLIGALVSMSESLKLTADLLDAQVQAPVDKSAWPELANFACFACHHDLASKAWRQQREYLLPPGRPYLHEWPVPLAQVAVHRLEKGPPQLQLHREAIRATLRAQPFGEPARLQAATRQAAEFLYQAAVQLQSQPLSREGGWQLMQELCRLGTTQTLDYDAARQLVWAVQILYSDLKANGQHRTPGQLTGWYTQRDDLDPVEQLLAGLAYDPERRNPPGMFVLDLREGRKTQQVVVGQERPQTEVELQRTLPPVATYAPDAFQARMKALCQHLEQMQQANRTKS